MLIAHGGHWAVTVSYVAPVVAFFVWLGFVTVRQRRQRRQREQGSES